VRKWGEKSGRARSPRAGQCWVTSGSKTRNAMNLKHDVAREGKWGHEKAPSQGSLFSALPYLCSCMPQAKLFHISYQECLNK
jgi:hypothetical protein